VAPFWRRIQKRQAHSLFFFAWALADPASGKTQSLASFFGHFGLQPKIFLREQLLNR
jgi:hypothetical protein